MTASTARLIRGARCVYSSASGVDRQPDGWVLRGHHIVGGVGADESYVTFAQPGQAGRLKGADAFGLRSRPKLCASAWKTGADKQDVAGLHSETLRRFGGVEVFWENWIGGFQPRHAPEARNVQ